MAKLLSGTRIYGTGTIDTQLFINGSLQAATTATGALNVPYGGAGIGGNLVVGGASTLTGAVIIVAATQAATTATGAVTVPYGGVGIGGNLVVGGTATATIALVIGTSQSASTATGALRVPFGGASIGGNLFVGGTATATTALVIGTSQAASTATGALRVPFGGASIGGNLVVGGTATATNIVAGSTQAGTTATGAITTPGGVGIGGNLFVGGFIVGTIAGTVSTASQLLTTASPANTQYYLPFVDTNNASATAETFYTSATISFNPTIGLAVGGTSAATAMLDVTGTAKISGITTVTSTAQAGTTATGALQVPFGGVGVGGNLVVGGASTLTGAVIVASVAQAGTTATGALTVPFGGVGIGGNLVVGGISTVTNTAKATSTTTGALQVVGGVAVGQDLFVGNTATILSVAASTSTLQDNALYVAGGAGIAGSLLVQGQVVFRSDVTFAGTTTNVFSTNTVYTDNMIELHSPGGLTATWTLDDGKDIGIRLHYYTGTDKNAFLGLANDTKYLEWYGAGVESTGTSIFTSATYGTFKTGQIILSSSTAATSTSTGALVVTGGVGIGGDLRVNGIIYGTINASVNTATNADNVKTVYQPASATYYPAFVDSNNAAAAYEALYTTSSFNINPSTGQVTADTFASTNNNNGTNFKVGDDAWIGDINSADTLRVMGQQSNANGYIVFGNSDTTKLGRAGSGALTYNGSFSVTGTAQAGTTATGALTVPYGGVGIGGNLVVGGITTVTNTAQAGTTTTGALQVYGGAGIGGNVVVGGSSTITNSEVILGTTQAGTTNTGALTVPFGGVGIGGNLVVGGSSTITNSEVILGTTQAATTNTGALRVPFGGVGVGGNLVVGGISTVTNATTASSTTTGALQVAGGIGIGNSIIAGGFGRFNGAYDEVASTTTVALYVGVAGGTPSSPRVGFANSGTTWQIDNYNGNFRWYIPGSVKMQLDTVGAWTVYNTATVASTTQASSTITGAFQVQGGAGIGGNLYVGGLIVGTIAATVSTASQLVTIASPSNTQYYLSFVDSNNASSTAETYYTSSTISFNPTLGLAVGGTAAATAMLDITGTAKISGITTVSNTLNALGTTQAGTTNTGALVVPFGGVGIGGNLVVGGSSTVTNNEVILGTTNASSTATGAFQVRGGAGFGNDVWVGGGMTITNALRVSSNTDASPTGGAIFVAGGVSMGGGLTVGGTLINAPSANAIIGGITTVTNTTAASSTITGALQVAGGAGIAGTLYVGNNLNVVDGQMVLNGRESTDGSIKFQVNIVSTGTYTSAPVSGINFSNAYQAGANAGMGGISVGKLNTTSGDYSSYLSLHTRNNGGSVTEQLRISNTGITTIYTTTNATSTASGSLQVLGGVGIGGNLYVGGLIVGTIAASVSTASQVNVVSTPANTQYYLSFVDSNNATATAESVYTSATISFNPTLGLAVGGTSAATAMLDVSGTARISGITTVSNTLNALGTTQAATTNTGALVVPFGGVGIGGNLFVGGKTTATSFTAGTGGANDPVFTSSGIYRTGGSFYINGGSTGSAPSISGGSGLVAGNNGPLDLYGGSTGNINLRTAAAYSTVVVSSSATYSTATGAFQVIGGVGIGGSLFVGGTATATNIVAGSTQAGTTATGAITTPGGVGIGGNLLVGGITTVTNTTQSSNTVTGALQVLGGVGIGGNLWVGGTINGTAATATSINVVAQPTNANYFPTFVDSNNATGVAENFYTSATIQFNPGIGLGIGGAPTATLDITGTARISGITTISNTLNALGNLVVSGASTLTGAVIVSSTTAASSTATGALQVRGGVGVGGDLYAANIYTNGTRAIPLNIQEFTATAGQTTFTISGGYTVGTVQVFANGINLGSGDITASNGTTVVVAEARKVGDIIRVISGGASTAVNNIQNFSIAMSVAMAM